MYWKLYTPNNIYYQVNTSKYTTCIENWKLKKKQKKTCEDMDSQNLIHQ
jgi:hypothetical protein